MSSPFGVVAQAEVDGDHINGWSGLVIAAVVIAMGGTGWVMWSMMRDTGRSASDPHEDGLAPRY